MMIIIARGVSGDDFYTRIRREVGALALLAIVVADIVCVFFVKLGMMEKRCMKYKGKKEKKKHSTITAGM